MSPRGGASVNLQQGTVARLDSRAGFGYVRDAKGENSYIFLIGKAIKHAQVRKLSIGKPVSFRVSGQGHVDEVVVA